MRNGHIMLFRILSNPHLVLILQVECLFTKKNPVSFQSYIPLVPFPRMSRRKWNQISLHFSFFFFLHEVSREENLLFKAIASVATGRSLRLSVPSWSQGSHWSSKLCPRPFPDLAVILERKPTQEKITEEALATDFFREEDGGYGNGGAEVEDFNHRFFS